MHPLPVPLPARLATQAEARAFAAALCPDYRTLLAQLSAAGQTRYDLHNLLENRLPPCSPG
jgi:hypothetical protein